MVYLQMSVKHNIKGSRSRKPVSHRIDPSGHTSIDETIQNSSKPFQNATNVTSALLDPAEKILFLTEEAKRKRQQDEVQLALLKIQQRVHCTLNDYEEPNLRSQSEIDQFNAEINLEGVNDPSQLYEVLRNSRQRSKYLQMLSDLIYGFEEKCEDRKRVLSSLNEFFLETQTANPQKLFDLAEENEFDFNCAASSLHSTVDTAQQAARRLSAIEQEMSKFVAISAAYPDTKKGRKKMENALLKAQDEVNTLSISLTRVQTELKESTSQVKELQQQIETRYQDSVSLKFDTSKFKYLEIVKDRMSKELKAAQEEIKTLRLRGTKPLTVPKSKLSSEDLSEMEHKFTEDLQSEKERLQNQHEKDLKVMKDNLTAEMERVKAYYEKQLRQQIDDQPPASLRIHNNCTLDRVRF